MKVPVDKGQQRLRIEITSCMDLPMESSILNIPVSLLNTALTIDRKVDGSILQRAQVRMLLFMSQRWKESGIW